MPSFKASVCPQATRSAFFLLLGAAFVRGFSLQLGIINSRKSELLSCSGQEGRPWCYRQAHRQSSISISRLYFSNDSPDPSEKEIKEEAVTTSTVKSSEQLLEESTDESFVYPNGLENKNEKGKSDYDGKSKERKPFKLPKPLQKVARTLFWVSNSASIALGTVLSIGLLLNIFGYAYIIDPNEGLRIDTIEQLRTERQFALEAIRLEKEADAEAKRKLLDVQGYTKSVLENEASISASDPLEGP